MNWHIITTKAQKTFDQRESTNYKALITDEDLSETPNQTSRQSVVLKESQITKNPFQSRFSSNHLENLERTVSKDNLDSRSLESRDLQSNNFNSKNLEQEWNVDISSEEIDHNSRVR